MTAQLAVEGDRLINSAGRLERLGGRGFIVQFPQIKDCRVLMQSAPLQGRRRRADPRAAARRRCTPPDGSHPGRSPASRPGDILGSITGQARFGRQYGRRLTASLPLQEFAQAVDRPAPRQLIGSAGLGAVSRRRDRNGPAQRTLRVPFTELAHQLSQQGRMVDPIPLRLFP